MNGFISLLCGIFYGSNELMNSNYILLICIFLLIVFVAKFLHTYIYHKKQGFFKSDFVVLTFFCLSIVATVFFVSSYLPAYKANTIDDPIFEVAAPSPLFSADSLDQCFLNLEKHDSILANAIQENDYNHILDYENYYFDKLSVVSDPHYVDISYWALGIIKYYSSPAEAYNYFAKVKNRDIYKYNLYVGLINYNAGKYIAAERSLKKEYLAFGKTDCLNMYFNVLLKNKNYSQAKLVFNLEKNRLDKNLASVYLVYDHRILEYVKLQFKLFLGQTKIINYAIAAFIAFTWFFFLFYSDIFQKERFRYLLFVALLETLLVFACPFIYKTVEYEFGWSLHTSESIWGKLFYAIGCISFVEEFVKLIPLLVLMAFTKEPDDSYDYIFYISVSALAFAFVENCLYFSSATGYGVYNGRALFSTIAHLYSSCMVAYGFMSVKYNKMVKNKAFTIILFVFGGIVFHGLYDFFLFVNFNVLFYLGYFMSIVVWVVLLNNSLNNSKFFNFEFNNKFNIIQIVIGVNLSLVMIIEYTLNALNYGYVAANSKLLYQMLVYGVVISFFISRLARYDLVKGYWRNVVFNGYESGGYMYHKFNVLAYLGNFFLLNRITPRNYVGKTIQLTNPLAGFAKNDLFKDFSVSKINGKIKDRVIFRKPILNKNKTLYVQDPQWFLLELDSECIEPKLQGIYALVFKFMKPTDELYEEKYCNVIVYKSLKEQATATDNQLLITDFVLLGIASIKENIIN